MSASPRPAAPQPSLPAAAAVPPVESAVVAQRIGRYETRSLLGEGGMGRVFLAFDTELERLVALKIIHQHLVGNERILARFRQEARAVARLNHPGIVQIYEFGQDAAAAPFLAMEYVEGRSLAGLLAARGPLDADPALRLTLSAVQALEYALTQNIVHRDIKPANLLISRLGILKVLDFGLARCLEAESDLTQSGTIVGSPYYMSPEQGKGERADHRSDIYSLGVTLYYMLSGSRPFEADSPLAIMLKHVQEPLPCSERIAPMLGGRVQALVERMTAKAPEDRFQTYADLRGALRELLALATPGSGAVALAVAAPPAAPTVPSQPPTPPPYPIADLMVTQALPQTVPNADSGATVTAPAFPLVSPTPAPIAPPPPSHAMRLALVLVAVVALAVGLAFVALQAYRAGLSDRAAATQATPTAAAMLPPLPSPSPSTPAAIPPGRLLGRGLQALDSAALDRFFSEDRQETNQARILGDRQKAITEKIRNMDFTGALADLDNLRMAPETPGEAPDVTRIMGLASLTYIVAEMAQFQEDIVAYLNARSEPLELPLAGEPPRTLRVHGASAQDLRVSLVAGASPYAVGWNENETGPQQIYRMGVKAYESTMSDDQRRRLTIFARYYGVQQAPGERLMGPGGASRPGAPGGILNRLRPGGGTQPGAPGNGPTGGPGNEPAPAPPTGPGPAPAPRAN